MTGPVRALVGRSAELEALTHALSDAAGPSTIVVEGPAGVGKSALLAAAIDRLPEGSRQATRLIGSEWAAATPYALLGQLHVETSPDDDPLAVAERLLDSVSPVLGLIVVEHAHAADASSLQALHTAVMRSGPQARLVLLTRGALPTEVPDIVTVPLAGLTLAEVGDLLRAAGVRADTRVARAVHTATGGNPADVLDLTRETPDHAWSTRHPVFGPTRAHRSRMEQLQAHLPEETWSLLQAMAVLRDDHAGRRGDDVPLGSVTALAGVDPGAADAALTSGVVVADRGHDGVYLAFTHPMCAAAVAAVAGPNAIRALHRRAAESAADPGDRLRHLVAAAYGPSAELAGLLLDYAHDRASAGAWGQSAQALIDASRLTEDPRRRAAHLVAAVDAFAGAGRLAEAEELVADVASLPPTARTDATLGYLAILRGRPDEAESLLRRAWSERAGADPDDVVLVCARQVLHALAMCDGQDLVTWADRAVEIAPDSPMALESKAIRGLGLASLGDWAGAQRQYEELSDRVPATAQSQRVAMGRGWFELLIDDPLSARTRLEQSVPTDVTLGSARISLWAQAWLARTLVVLGEWDACLDVVDRAAAQVAATGHELVRPLVHWPAAQVHALRGDTAAAHRHLRWGAAADHGYPIMRAPAALARAQVAEAEADYAGVLRALDPLHRWIGEDAARDPGYWPWVDVRGNALVLLGRVEEAERFVTPHLDLARRRGHRSGIARAELVMGRVFGARGDIDAASAAFERAEHELRYLPMPLDLARTQFAHGQTLRRAGRRREADEVMRAARDLFGGLGAVRYVDRCDRELKASGVERTRTVAGGGLTPQEAAVVELVARGRTNKEAAEELYVSVKTIQYHLTRIYAKLGLRSRVELAARYGPAGDPAPDA